MFATRSANKPDARCTQCLGNWGGAPLQGGSEGLSHKLLMMFGIAIQRTATIPATQA